MLNIKNLFRAFIVFSCLCLTARADLNQPKPIYAEGNATSAAVSCSLQVAGANGYIVILDGTNVATSSVTVAVQVFNPINSVWSTPVTIGGVSQPITLTNATTQVVNVVGSFPGIRINVTSFGTATGTFQGYISAY